MREQEPQDDGIGREAAAMFLGYQFWESVPSSTGDRYDVRAPWADEMRAEGVGLPFPSTGVIVGEITIKEKCDDGQAVEQSVREA